MTETGRGAAACANTVSPDNARPGPAGHKRGRKTNACKPSVIEREHEHGAHDDALEHQPHADEIVVRVISFTSSPNSGERDILLEAGSPPRGLCAVGCRSDRGG